MALYDTNTEVDPLVTLSGGNGSSSSGSSVHDALPRA